MGALSKKIGLPESASNILQEVSSTRIIQSLRNVVQTSVTQILFLCQKMNRNGLVIKKIEIDNESGKASISFGGGRVTSGDINAMKLWIVQIYENPKSPIEVTDTVLQTLGISTEKERQEIRALFGVKTTEEKRMAIEERILFLRKEPPNENIHAKIKRLEELRFLEMEIKIAA